MGNDLTAIIYDERISYAVNRQRILSQQGQVEPEQIFFPPQVTLQRLHSLKFDGVAYAFIVDNRGEIIAHTLGTFPPEVRQGLAANGQRETARRELSLRDKTIYETSVPILEGQVGTAHQ